MEQRGQYGGPKKSGMPGLQDVIDEPVHGLRDLDHCRSAEHVCHRDRHARQLSQVDPIAAAHRAHHIGDFRSGTTKSSSSAAAAVPL
jgi:hypothetical protein